MMNKFKQWFKKYRIVIIFIWFIWIVSVFSFLAFSDHEYFILKSDKYYFKNILGTIFVITGIIEIFFLSGKRIPYITLSFICLFPSFQILYIFNLKNSNTPFYYTQASIIDYYKEEHIGRYGKNTFYYHTLRFSNNEFISEKEITEYAYREFPTHKNDCISVQYRENAWLIELRPIKNLGQMPTDKCLAGFHTP